jgi:hypothetical protein
MRKTIYFLLFIAFTSCNSSILSDSGDGMIDKIQLANTDLGAYPFLDCMYQDSYFPKFLVDKCKNILLNLCLEIESTEPSSLAELYKLTRLSTEKLNALENEFFENNSEIESVARDCLAVNIEFIAKSYGFDADIEELISGRDW